jgi:hypothetical protein
VILNVSIGQSGGEKSMGRREVVFEQFSQPHEFGPHIFEKLRYRDIKMIARVHAGSERGIYILDKSRTHVTIHVTLEMIGHNNTQLLFAKKHVYYKALTIAR